ncbi:MAG: carboxypeptidase M32, partial [Fusobacteriaceae bacterium]
EYSELTATAQNIWAEARETNDFFKFQDSLEKIFLFSKKFANYRKKDGEDLYNIILSDYEKGMDIQKLDLFFETLKVEIVPILKKIKEKNLDYSKILTGSVPVENQKKFSRFIGQYLGFDFNRGVLAESAHPFTLTVNMDDVRLTTRYIENLPLSSIFSTIHETGHGIYEQGIAPSLKDTTLADGTSMGIHESQSRFYENIVGRSENFWEVLFPKLQNEYEYLKNISFQDFYRGINSVQPSLIRVEADELTYSLHIMVRYEIEKGIFRGDYEIENLPQIWREKMEEYLGISPDNDSDGVLQDVHWSCGLIGYFPSYALGNAYSLQILHAMKKDLDVDALLKKGELEKIKDWLQKKIHIHGKSKTPEEIILAVTGESLNPKYYIDYLKDKYTLIYNI